MTRAPAPPDPSYRALLAVPWLSRILLSMMLARIAQSMVAIALVLFTLAEFNSPALAGLVTLASTLPGILVSPIAGALLDRHGRMRLVLLDYIVALLALALIAGLSIANALPDWLLVLIAAVGSLTAILSATGVRSLFPIIVPKPLWERVNAVDSNGYIVATIIGPPLAAGLVTILGGAPALMGTAVVFGIAAAAMVGIPDPPTEVDSTGRLMQDALDGLKYAWRNRTIRGLAFSISALNIVGGTTTIVIPLIVIDRLGFNPAVVGLVFAVSGIAGMVSALAFGRIDSRGVEWRLLVWPLLVFAPAVLLLVPPAVIDGMDPALGLLLLGGWSIIGGVATGPMDIGLFTIRQRRTDPAWMGRAFAVSMALNFVGFPIGAAIAGVLATQSVGLAMIPAIVAVVLSVVLAATMVPRTEDAVA